MSRVTLRTATVSDIPTLERWDLDPDVVSSTSDDPEQSVAFGEENDWNENIALYQPDVWEYWIAEVDGRPIGAMQMIDPHIEPTHYWAEIEPNLRALDIWIGEPEARGKGYGEEMMRLGIERSFARLDVTAIIIDPLASNTRAHKFYQRIGFKPVGRQRLGDDDDDCLVHKLTRQEWEQSELARRFDAVVMSVDRDAKLGVSRDLVQHFDKRPIHGLRHAPEGDTCGWYVWKGELSSDPEFFVPLHAGHLIDSHPFVSRYLGLPPGWRFLITESHEDVWFDPTLLTTRQGD